MEKGGRWGRISERSCQHQNPNFFRNPKFDNRMIEGTCPPVCGVAAQQNEAKSTCLGFCLVGGQSGCGCGCGSYQGRWLSLSLFFNDDGDDMP